MLLRQLLNTVRSERVVEALGPSSAVRPLACTVFLTLLVILAVNSAEMWPYWGGAMKMASGLLAVVLLVAAGFSLGLFNEDEWPPSEGDADSFFHQREDEGRQ